MNRKAGAILLIGAVLLLLAAFWLSSLLPARPGMPPVRVTELAPVEIRNYEGSDLSSLNDFRENSIRGPRHVNISEYRLTVAGLVARPQTFSYDELLAQFPHSSKVVTLFCVEGWDATILWEGIRVKDILAGAGPDPAATTVIFRAADGYSTSLPLDFIVNRDIIMAYRMNNVTLPAERGYPFQLVAEDRWGYKWIKWITEIELSGNSNYRGYWEQRGYSTTADLGKSFFAD